MILGLLDSTEIALKPDLEDPNEYLAVQATFFAMYTVKLIKEVEIRREKETPKDKVKEAFLVAEYIHTEANSSAVIKFEKIYFYCLQAQVNLTKHPWVLDQMPPAMKERYKEMFRF